MYIVPSFWVLLQISGSVEIYSGSMKIIYLGVGGVGDMVPPFWVLLQISGGDDIYSGCIKIIYREEGGIWFLRSGTY